MTLPSSRMCAPTSVSCTPAVWWSMAAGKRCWTVPGHPYTRMLVGSLLTLSDEPADLSSLVIPTGTNGPAMSGGCPVQNICSECHRRLSA
jgi:hypothetical protein